MKAPKILSAHELLALECTPQNSRALRRQEQRRDDKVLRAAALKALEEMEPGADYVLIPEIAILSTRGNA